MNFDFAERVNPALQKHAYTKAIAIAESGLKETPFSNFHSVLGQSLVHQAGSLMNWVDKFYETVSKEIALGALYFEMNEFDINTDVWYIDGFAYTQDGGLDIEDMEWLSDVSEETMTSEEFVLTSYEKLQEVFEAEELDTQELESARDWCEQIIIVRFMELMRTVHLRAKEKDLAWAKLPLYYTIHSYDFVVKSEV
ncbi:hypothetical protein [Rufibacter sp. XAAS-G3-1]|uniref:hypothetical protein n=1 Tax=Rufibacter sp. XAAS-G3-1 TaxID=2729134 RepID=UPI0015E716AF|nr:hypothetical protein [Rufibacter sp. XAAS-G3-1]